MWKGAAVFLLASLAVGWHFWHNQQAAQVPTLPSTYWGPGAPVADSKEIKPFKINVAKEVIDDLNARLDKTRTLVEPLEGAAWTYGISSKYLKTVLNYWRNKYDWNKRQALLNKYPQFTTKVQGLNIHFYHVKPTVSNSKVKVLPLLLVHGWPGSVVEFQKIIPLLTTVQRDLVFELVIPSLPGYGFSQATNKPGLGTAQMAVIFKNLMHKLGFEKFYTQGGDWGAIITANLAALFPKSVIGAHLNMCYIDSPKAVFWTLLGSYVPSLVIDSEKYTKMYPLSHHLPRLLEESGYMHIQATKPDTVGTGLTDSPAGLAAYILEKFSTWTNPDYRFRDDGGLEEKFSLDELLDNLMVYWVTGSITTSQRLYAEKFNKAVREQGIDNLPIEVPTACAMFPHELIYRTESILKERYVNMLQFTDMPSGGHFAAFEEPQLMAEDIFSFAQKREQQRAQERKAEREKQKQQQQQKKT